jgi:hypothetical protein
VSQATYKVRYSVLTALQESQATYKVRYSVLTALQESQATYKARYSVLRVLQEPQATYKVRYSVLTALQEPQAMYKVPLIICFPHVSQTSRAPSPYSFILVFVDGVSLCLWTATTNGPIVHSPDNIYEHGDPWWNYTDRRKVKIWQKNLSQCHFVHHKSHKDWPGPRRLTAWATALSWFLLQALCKQNHVLYKGFYSFLVEEH